MTVQIIDELPEFQTVKQSATSSIVPPSSPAVVLAQNNFNNDNNHLINNNRNGAIQPILKAKIERLFLNFRPLLPTGQIPSRGDLYIAENALYFHDSMSKEVYVIDYPSILIHAISRGGSNGNESTTTNTTIGDDTTPMVYCQLDSFGLSLLDSNGNEINCSSFDENNDNDNDDHEDDEERLFEMEIIPDEPDQVDIIFQALSECAALHPDKDIQDDEDDMYNHEPLQDKNDGMIMMTGSNGWMYSAENIDELNEMGRATLAHLETVFDIPEGQTFNFKTHPSSLNQGHQNEEDGATFEEAD